MIKMVDKKKLKVLLTASSGPGAVGIIHALRNHPNKHIFIVTGSVEDYEDVSLKIADKYVKIPFSSDEDFVSKMIRICKENNIDLIVPAYSQEILELAKNEEVFLREGIHILCPSFENIFTAHNKDIMYEQLQRLNCNCYPNFKFVNSVDELKSVCLSMGYPQKKLCVKPAVCNGGSRGFFVLDENYDRFKNYFLEKEQPICSLDELLLKLKGLKRIPRIIVMDYLSGPEYGIDVVAKEGEVISYVVRKRLHPQVAGIDMRVKIENREDLSDFTKKIVKNLKLNSIVNIDIRYDEEMNKPYILEINPRQSAYIGTSAQKINLLSMAIDLKLGEKINVDNYKKNYENIVGVRYFGEFNICDNELVFFD